MKAVILAAGYATRLYPLTRDEPKHLLEVAGRPILDRLLGQLPLEELDAVFVVTNAKFAGRFREWAAGAQVEVEVIDDGTTSEEDKVGAIGDLEAIRRLSAIGVDPSDRVVSFEEKPESPSSTLAGIALYFFPRDVLPLVGEYLGEGNNPDQPGRFVEWLYMRVPVYAWRVPGQWIDIGTPDALAEAERAFSN